MANVIDITTEDNLQYTFYPVSSGGVSLRVRAPNDAHIALTTGPMESDPMYEIIIGGWANSKSVIRRNRQKPDKIEVELPDLLNAGEFRAFWIRWDCGIISAGRDGEPVPFISWQDPEPFPIGFIGVCTGWGATGTWKIEDGENFDTPDKLAYRFGPVMSGSLQFAYKGPHNCHLALTTGPKETENIYEIIIGGWENTQSVIRYKKQQPDKVIVPTEGIVHPGEFRNFQVEWWFGQITVKEGNGRVIMEWLDVTPFPVTHFAVRTGWGARGQWKLNYKGPSAGKPLFGWTVPTPGSGYPSAGGYPAPGGYPGSGYPSAPSAPLMMAPSGGGGGAVWVDAASGQMPPGAVVGGQDGEALYVARARHEGALIPGKLAPSHGVAYVAWGGAEHGKQQYQVLCGGNPNWVPVNGSNIPPGAFPGGESEDGEPLFVGRVRHEGSVTVGKVQPSHGVCYIPYGGQELGFPDYEVLVMY